MADKTWKAYERRKCKELGGKRRGADYGDRNGGKNDCEGVVGFSVEIKKWARPTFSIMLEDVKKAEARREIPCDLPIAVMSRVGDLDADALVVFRWETFMKEVYPILKQHALMAQLGYDERLR